MGLCPYAVAIALFKACSHHCNEHKNSKSPFKVTESVKALLQYLTISMMGAHFCIPRVVSLITCLCCNKMLLFC